MSIVTVWVSVGFSPTRGPKKKWRRSLNSPAGTNILYNALWRRSRASMPSLSRSLEQALHRAIKLASDRHHEYATLEHLLLALMDDSDAQQVMKACNVDTESLRKAVQKYVDEELITLVIEDGEEAKPTTGFTRVIQRAVLHVQNSGRGELPGAT